MIAELLKRWFIMDQLSDVELYLSNYVEAGASLDAEGTEEVRHEDYGEALELVRATAASEKQESSGQIGFEPSSTRRRSKRVEPLDNISFFSRDPVINILQSALNEYFEEHAQSRKERIEVIAAPAAGGRRRRGRETEVPVVTDRFLPEVKGPSGAPSNRRLLNKFSITDPGWVSSAVAKGIRMFRGKHQFNDHPPAPLSVNDRARLIVVGDWASGLPRAQRLAIEMRRFLEEGKRENREVHVFHLGDTYYSGWESEYKNRFLPYWPVRTDEADSIGSWSLNANHDMYSGGHAYYDYLLADERFKRQSRSSYFELFNQHWQILSLDTGWETGKLAGSQAKWVDDATRNSGRKVILLSHHQLFSAYEPSSTDIANALRDVLAQERICAWFWGHEHRCMFFKPYQGVRYGRCVGHGGVPVYMPRHVDEPYPEPGEYEYREYREGMGGLEQWALFGFVVLDFEGPVVRVRYVNEYGNVHKEESFE